MVHDCRVRWPQNQVDVLFEHGKSAAAIRFGYGSLTVTEKFAVVAQALGGDGFLGNRALTPVIFDAQWRSMTAETSEGNVIGHPWRENSSFESVIGQHLELQEYMRPHLRLVMNTLHGADESERYWEILVGSWLTKFSYSLREKWDICDFLATRGEVVNLLPPTRITEPPRDTPAALSLLESRVWNEDRIGEVLKIQGQVSFEEVPTAPSPLVDWAASDGNRRHNLEQLQVDLRNGKVFLGTLGIGRVQQAQLSAMLGQSPTSVRPFRRVRGSKPYSASKRAHFDWLAPRSQFERWLEEMFFIHLPRVFLEDFSWRRSRSRKSVQRKRHISALVSGGIHADDELKFRCAEIVKSGGGLAVIQHGGGYGQLSVFDAERYEISIADTFFSWGWHDKSEPKIKPLGTTKKATKSSFSPKGLLFVTEAQPRFVSSLRTGPQSFSYEISLRNQVIFFDNLSESVRSNTRVRLYQKDYGWKHKERWEAQRFIVQFDNENQPFKRSLKRSRVFVSDYCATTFLEAVLADIPSVIYLDSSIWSFRSEAEQYFSVLREVGVLHETPLSAAKFLNDNYWTIQTWWSSPEVTNAMKIFREQYCATRPNIANELSRELRLR